MKYNFQLKRQQYNMFAIKGTGYGLFPFFSILQTNTEPVRIEMMLGYYGRALSRTKQNFAGWLARKASQEILTQSSVKYAEKTRANFYVDRFLIRQDLKSLYLSHFKLR